MQHTTRKAPRLSLNTDRRRLRFPPGAETKALLPDVAHTLRGMQTPATVIVRDTTEADALRQEVQVLKTKLTAAQSQAAERAHREDRLKAITLHVRDNRAAWAAKMGLRKPPLVAITSQHVITCDVWDQRRSED